MPATESQASTFGSLGRSILSIRRDSMEPFHDSTSQELELESFQKQVTDRFIDLSSSSPEHFLSLSWLRTLLDVFICCQEEFRVILFNNKSHLNKTPMDRLVSEFFDRSVKALDVCNAIRDGIDQVRQWQKLLEIVSSSFHAQPFVGEGHFRRARKALNDLAVEMLDDKDSTSGISHRNRSFGRRDQKSSLRHFRSLSWSVSRSWSAARQIQAIANNLAAPKANEVLATNGLAVAAYTMNSVLLFVMWALVAAIPCQDRGLQIHFAVPRQYIWSAPIMSLHERITEESKKRERKNSSGLLREIYQVEKCVRNMNELTDSAQFPLNEEKVAEVKQGGCDVALVCDLMMDGLEPLERQVREVFHRIVRSRTEGLDCLVKTTIAD